jgi:hypothetical protein
MELRERAAADGATKPLRRLHAIKAQAPSPPGTCAEPTMLDQPVDQRDSQCLKHANGSSSG